MRQKRSAFVAVFMLVFFLLLVMPKSAYAQQPPPTTPDAPLIVPGGDEVKPPNRSISAATTNGFELTVFPNTKFGLTYNGGSQFYETTASGLFLWVGDQVFGPAVPFGYDHNAFEEVGFTQTGAGTPGDPFRFTTTVRAPGTGVKMVSRITYISLQKVINFETTLTNEGSNTQDLALFHAGDMYLDFPDNLADYGYGTRRASSGAIGATTSSGDWAFFFEPVSPAASAFQETDIRTTWRAIGDTTRGPGFNNTFRSDFHDVSGGLQWSLQLAPGASQVITHRLRLEALTPRAYAPQIDGFGFNNWTEATPLSRRDFVEYFGTGGTCPASGECTLDASAEAWYTANFANAGEGGHCYGLSIMSAFIYRSIFDPATFESNVSTAFGLQRVSSLERNIAFLQSLQSDYRIANKLETTRVNSRPDDILARIDEAFAANNLDPVTIGIYGQVDGSSGLHLAGHALEPYARVDMPDGKIRVMVYDSNHSGDPNRYIEFSPKGDSWSYPMGNGFLPVEGIDMPGSWAGDVTHRALTVIPMSLNTVNRPRLPYESSGDDLLYISGDRQWLGNAVISDSSGDQLGYLDGELVREIPGTLSFLPLGGTSATIAPEFWVPTQDVSVTLASNVQQATEGSLLVMGDGFSLSVSGVDLSPDSQRTFGLTNGGTELSIGQPVYAGANNGVHAAAPTMDPIDIAYAYSGTGSDSASKTILLTGLNPDRVGGVTVELHKESGQVAVQNSGGGATEYNLQIITVAGTDTSSFDYDNVSVQAGTLQNVAFSQGGIDNEVVVRTFDANGNLLSEITLRNGNAGLKAPLLLPIIRR